MAGGVVKELSIFADESGGQNGHSKYYALSLVFHDQSQSIAEKIEKHRRGLRDRGLEDIPFHAGPLLTGHENYEYMSVERRKAHLTLFFIDFQKLPVTYHTFLYRRSEVGDKDAFTARMRRDLVNFFFDYLEFFQAYDVVKIYYDNGQEMVAQALHAAAEYALSKNVVLYRNARASEFFLSQAADLLCTLELTAQKYACNEATRTDELMFGCNRAFRKNYLKAIKRKRLSTAQKSHT